jgi:23S rRNA (cytidine2498-2'-O)-methyltransferase
MTQSTVLFGHVRPGFETDAAKELAESLSIPVSDVSIGTGFITAPIPLQHPALQRSWRSFIFLRQILFSLKPTPLNQEDRVGAIIAGVTKELLPALGINAFSGFRIETPDVDDIKKLSNFCKSLSRPLENQLNKLKLLPKGKGAKHLPELVIVLTDAATAYIAGSMPNLSCPWPMGIPRLKFPPRAPSRSTLKLDEAFVTFLTEEQQHSLFPEESISFDLGACPGGWTYQLVHRGQTVYAIDNGQIDSELMASGKVVHLTLDALTFNPNHILNGQVASWMVCDVVEQPAKMVPVISNWIINRWCQNIIFNIKLPMNTRFEEVKKSLQSLQDNCREKIECLAARQLYHDRKEITVYIAVK